MLLLGSSSGGNNIVGEAKARPPYYPAATVDAAWVEVFYQYRGEDDQLVGALISLGKFSPTAAVSLPENTTGLTRLSVFTVSYNSEGVPDVSRPEDGARLDLDLDRTTQGSEFAEVEPHVPTVTTAPTVTKSSMDESLVLFIPDPDAYGFGLSALRVRLRKADTLEELVSRPFPVSNSVAVPHAPFATKIDYAWQNKSIEDAGFGRGWSAYSAAADVPALGGDPIPSEITVTDFETDPHEVRDVRNKEPLLL